MPSVFVVIVNFRTGPLVVDCLHSLMPEVASLDGGKVVVVDNASEDGSAATIAAAIIGRGWHTWAELLELPRNGGFAYGNNHAIRRAQAIDPSLGTVILLNPDTTVSRGAISALVDHLHHHADAGIAGASIEDEGGSVQRTAHPFHSPLSELDSGAQLGVITRLIGSRSLGTVVGDTPVRCDWVSGACMAVRAELFASVGLLDEGYFLYFEETDFCLRARRAGWTCWYVPTARVVHFEGSSTGIRESKRRRPAYWFESRRRFFIKAYGIKGLLLADSFWALGRTTLALRRLFGLGGGRGRDEEPVKLGSDLLIGDLCALFGGKMTRNE